MQRYELQRIQYYTRFKNKMVTTKPEDKLANKIVVKKSQFALCLGYASCSCFRVIRRFSDKAAICDG